MTDFQNTQGIIFVVDSNDRERITEAREECKLFHLGFIEIRKLIEQCSEC